MRRRQTLAVVSLFSIYSANALGTRMSRRQVAKCGKRAPLQFRKGSGIGESNVLNRYIKGVVGVATLMAVGVIAVIAQTPAKQPQWQGGQDEYNLFTAVNNAKTPADKLTALNAWKAKYPT